MSPDPDPEYDAWSAELDRRNDQADRLRAEPGERPTPADLATARGYWREVERLRATAARKAG